MSYIANPQEDYKTWDYILGDVYNGFSIAYERFYYLDNLQEETLKVALHDPKSEYPFTKWRPFPGLLWHSEIGAYGWMKNAGLTAAIDVHRSMLPNEIVVESDYKTYEENYEAATLIGKILEKQGFIPHYYYSGNKSVHIHVFFDWDCLKQLDGIIQDQLRIRFRGSKLRFKKKFIEWLRTKIISCWDTNARKFDENLIKATHLIRCELSRNKQGYKTFLGYSHKDMSFIPYICNEENKIYPKIGKMYISNPYDVAGLINEFIRSMDIKKNKEDMIRRNTTLGDWGIKMQDELPGCVKLILQDDFKNYGDGFKRGMFILINELRRVHGDDKARAMMADWNSRMDFAVKDSEIEYRFKSKVYTLSSNYIHSFLKDLSIEIPKKCKHKI